MKAFRHASVDGKTTSIKEGFMAVRTYKAIPPLSPNDLERFWSGINKDGPIPEHMPHLGQCWVWTKSRFATGYGQMRLKYTRYGTHRLSWFIHNGAIRDGLFVCHKCDNPLCARPDHLFLGTNSENIQDASRKGLLNPPRVSGVRNGRYTMPERTARGERSGAAKLTDNQVLEIRKRLLSSKRYGLIKALASEYGVHRGTIMGIENRTYWKHL